MCRALTMWMIDSTLWLTQARRIMQYHTLLAELHLLCSLFPSGISSNKHSLLSSCCLCPSDKQENISWATEMNWLFPHSSLYASTKRLEDYPVYNASLSGLREGEGRTEVCGTARKQNSVAGDWGCGSRPFPVVLRGWIIKRGGLASRLLLYIV